MPGCGATHAPQPRIIPQGSPRSRGPPLPAAQDWDLAEVALLGTLRRVSLQGAGEGVTDDGVARLAALPRLERLSL